MNELRTISFGSLGDSFIVYLKLRQMLEENPDVDLINHLFVESNQDALCFIDDWFQLDGVEIGTECDKNYEKSFREGKWNDRTAINTSINGDYHFPIEDNISIKNPFVDFADEEKIYDVCIQCSAGVYGSRLWKFDIFRLAKMLRDKGFRVAIIGSDGRFVKEKDKDNYVGKRDLLGSMEIISKSQIFVGLSGFHTYWSLASKIPNIHYEESFEHNHHYIHTEWNKYRFPIKYGKIQEVLKGLKEFDFPLKISKNWNFDKDMKIRIS